MVRRIDKMLERVRFYNTQYKEVEQRAYKGVIGLFQRFGDAFAKFHYRERQWHYKTRIKSALRKQPLKPIREALQRSQEATSPAEKARAFSKVRELVGALEITVTDQKMDKIAAERFEFPAVDPESIEELLGVVTELIQTVHVELVNAEQALITSIGEAAMAIKEAVSNGDENGALGGMRGLVALSDELDENQELVRDTLQGAVEGILKHAKQVVSGLDTEQKNLKESSAKMAREVQEAREQNQEKLEAAKRRLAAFRIEGPIAPYIPEDSLIRNPVDDEMLQTVGYAEALDALANKLDKRGQARALLAKIPADLREDSLPSERKDEYASYPGKLSRAKTSEQIQVLAMTIHRQMNIGPWKMPDQLHPQFWGKQWLTDIVVAGQLMAAAEKSNFTEVVVEMLRARAKDAHEYRQAYGYLQQAVAADPEKVSGELDALRSRASVADDLSRTLQRIAKPSE